MTATDTTARGARGAGGAGGQARAAACPGGQGRTAVQMRCRAAGQSWCGSGTMSLGKG